MEYMVNGTGTSVPYIRVSFNGTEIASRKNTSGVTTLVVDFNDNTTEVASPKRGTEA